MKKCFKCNHIKPLAEFYKHNEMTDGHLGKCKWCTKRDSKTWHQSNPERSKELRAKERYNNRDKYHKSTLKLKYGITPDIYAQMLLDQNDCCAICNKHKDSMDTRMYVDHNHETGAIRGLLCRKCNAGIGMLNDNFDLVLKAAKYLREKDGII